MGGKLDKFLVLDVETANEARSSICQIGIVYVSSFEVQTKIGFFLNPECSFSTWNTNIHGIRQSDVKNSRKFNDIYELLSKILTMYPVYHHGLFDRQAIDSVCEKYSRPKLTIDWHDTEQLLRTKLPSNNKFGLKDLCQHFNIEHLHHDAEEDALATAKVLCLSVYNKELVVPKRLLSPNMSAENKAERIIVFTGDMPKKQLESIARERGYEVASSVTKKTTHLCFGKTDQRTLDSGHKKSGKHRKAEELRRAGQQINILTETQFLQLSS